jgi:peptidoglycan/LPS O-acetylase OafA/YrhL
MGDLRSMDGMTAYRGAGGAPGETLRYAPHLDGLRALAVAAVFAFHLGAPGFSGGFAGVDVFIVISGFVICHSITGLKARDAFSVTRFYASRVLRIWPALALTVGAVLAVSVLVDLPEDTRAIALSGVFALLGTSNFYFARHVGYFNQDVHPEPLLHTWSLGLEVQFYALIPGLLLAPKAPRARRLANWSLPAVAAISFAASALAAAHHSNSGFYMLPTRLWEFLIGVLLRKALQSHALGRRTREACGAVGIAGLCAGLLALSPEVPYPSFAALAPTLSAALVIASGWQGVSTTAGVLSWRPLRWVGRISYSLYLWHWPVIIYLGLLAEQLHLRSAFAFSAACLAASGVIASLSWRYVEAPLRPRPVAPAPDVWRRAGAPTLATMALLGLAFGCAGFPGRLPERARAFQSYLAYKQDQPFRTGTCFLGDKNSLGQFDTDLCLGRRRTAPHVLLIGDSHAAALWYGLQKRLGDVVVSQATAQGCRPTIARQPNYRPACSVLMDTGFQAARRDGANAVLVLAGRWRAEDAPDVAATAASLQQQSHVRVLVVGPSPEYDTPLPRLLALKEVGRLPEGVNDHLDPSVFRTDELLGRSVTVAGARYVSVLNALCGPAHACPATVGPAVPLLFDAHHFTREGSTAAAVAVGDAVLQLAREPSREPAPQRAAAASASIDGKWR